MSPLPQGSMIRVVAMGAVFWFSVVLLIRVLAPLGALEGGMRVLVYLLVIPGTVPFVWLFQWAAGLTRETLFTGFTIGTPEYQVTAVTWVRGILQDVYNVAPVDMHWRWGGLQVCSPCC